MFPARSRNTPTDETNNMKRISQLPHLLFPLLGGVIGAYLCFASPSAEAQTGSRKASLSESFFTASQLRASGQRIARLYLEGGLELRPHRTRILIEQEIKSYSARMDELKRQKQDVILQKHLAKVMEAWTEMRPLAASGYTFSKEHAERVYDLSEQLYIHTSKIAYHLEDQAESESGYLADVSGRNAALSERIAKAALLYAITKKGGSLVDFATWKKEYTDGYAKLEETGMNDEYAKSNLKLGRMMWDMFEVTITGVTRKSDATRLIDISKCADGMWDIAQSSKKQYEVMFRQQMQQGGQLAGKASRGGS
jgi:hypothetical protein